MKDEITEAVAIAVTKNVREFLAIQKSSLLKRGSILPAIVQCEAEILKKLEILRTGVVNEAGLRFAIADPIMMLLCSFWNLKVCANICE